MQLTRIPCELCGNDDCEPVLEIAGHQVCKCRRCTLVYVNPQPRRELDADAGWYHDSEDAIGQSAFPALKRVYERCLRLLDRRHPKRGSLLDVGCGFGFFLDMARADGWDVHGVDVSAPAVQHCRDQLALTNVDRMELRERHAGGRTFEAVTMWNLLEHVSNPFQTLASVYGLLRPGGTLVVRVPNVAPRDMILSSSRRLRLGFKPSESFYLCGAVPPHHLFGFSPRTLRQMLSRAGFGRTRVLPSPLRWDSRLGRPVEYASRTLYACSLGGVNVAPTILALAQK